MSDNIYRPADRRPLAARSWFVLRWLSSGLSRRGISPNGISLIGMVAGLGAGALLAATFFLPEIERVLWFGTALLIGVRALANILDGMVAIESKRASPIGELFNEVPDRVSDSAMLIGLGFAKGSNLYLGCLAALAAVFTAYVRALGKVAGAPQNYRGPMAKPQRMFVVVIICILGFVAPGLLEFRLDSVDLALPAIALVTVIFGCVLTIALRLLDIAAMLRSRTR